MPNISGPDAEVAARVASIRDQLRQARQDRGWTLSELAEHAAVPLHLLESYERSGVDLGIAEFQQVCSALDLDIVVVLEHAQRAAESAREK